MSFDDYVNHITLKIGLATAIGILKSKPKNVTTENYINKLRRNLQMDYDSDATVCSDDFDVDCDDVINVEDNHNDNADNDFVVDVNNDVVCDKSIDNHFVHEINKENNIVVDNKSNNDKVFVQMQVDSQKSIPHVDLPYYTWNTNGSQKDDINDNILNVMKDNAVIEKPNIPQSQSTYFEMTQEQLNEEIDSDATFCESVSVPQNNNPKKNINDLEETQIYSLSDFSQFKMHYSETQLEKIVIHPKFIKNTNKTKLSDENDSNLANQKDFTQYAQNFDEFDVNSKDIHNTNDLDHKSIEDDTNSNKNNDFETQSNTNADFEEQSNDSNDDVADSQREVVPFKVLEELNKIKTYLKKKDRRLSYDGSDSGYRSDSQGRSSRNSLQLSGTSINQSAQSLLMYLITCPLNKATNEITKEISRALGTLIDKLHEEESYPSFLEVLLETIKELLTSIYEDDDNIKLLTKDEKIQRVLLLNKSSHVQKYTIDKITAILETIDTSEAYEINHTAKLENLCYIFHILEIILSKHKIVESSQPSQEKILKKSSITDIWRKKWNIEKAVIIDNVEKRCPLTKCSEVLNKMIVECMEGYSLISFVALKCFNLLQPS